MIKFKMQPGFCQQNSYCFHLFVLGLFLFVVVVFIELEIVILVWLAVLFVVVLVVLLVIVLLSEHNIHILTCLFTQV